MAALAGSNFSRNLSVRTFAEALNSLSDWFSFGVYLDAPIADLQRIQNKYENVGINRCLIEVYQCLETKGIQLSWESIVTSLRSMGNNGLADKIEGKYVLFDHSSTNPQPRPSSPVMVVIRCECVKDIVEEFKSLTEDFNLLLEKTKEITLESINSDMLDVIQDFIRRNYGLPNLSGSQLTVSEVFNRMETHCFHMLDCNILVQFIQQYLKNLDLLTEAIKFQMRVEKFKSSANMVELVALINSKQPDIISTSNHKKVQLKVCNFWRNFTMERFEKIINEILAKLYNVVQYVFPIERGCICISWLIPRDVNHAEMLPKLDLDFMKCIGVISLHIGDDVIYNIEQEGCETIEAAMLEAVKLQNTRAVELLLSVGCGPEVAANNGENEVTNIVYIRSKKKPLSDNEPHPLDEPRPLHSPHTCSVCVLGHNEHMDAILDPNSEYECSMCAKKEQVNADLRQDFDGLKQKLKEHLTKEEKQLEVISNPNASHKKCASCSIKNEMNAKLHKEINILQQKLKDHLTKKDDSNSSEQKDEMNVKLHQKISIRQQKLKDDKVESRTDTQLPQILEPMSAVPSVPDLCECLRDLVDWEFFAQYLPGIVQADISIIQKYKQGDVTEQKRALYEKWLQVHPNASWDDVVKALENPAVRENTIAQQVREKYMPLPADSSLRNNSKNFINSSDHSISPKSVHEFQATEVSVSEDIVEDLESMQRSFVELTKNVKSEVEQKVKTGITNIHSIVFRIQQERAFPIDSLRMVKNTDELFEAIHPHYNFLNCYLIVSIALFLSGSIAEKAIDYDERVKKFMKTTKITYLKNVLRPYCSQSRGNSFTIVVEIKVENGWRGQPLWLVRNLIEALFPVKHPNELLWYDIVPG